MPKAVNQANERQKNPRMQQAMSLADERAGIPGGQEVEHIRRAASSIEPIIGAGRERWSAASRRAYFNMGR